ncbi:MAG: radical SAM protein [Bacteroidetes bacterium]|nr:radical SAM protein [Bacteroidota bacterium]
MHVQVLLITPPFTQLNTPYPATAYLKGFLNTKSIHSYQCDLGIEVILKLFTKEKLQLAFQVVQNKIEKNEISCSENSLRIHALQASYVQAIEPVISFLQGKNPMLAHTMCLGHFLPHASRFAEQVDMHHAFGTMGLQDQAKYLCTMFLEDLSDYLKECLDEHFGFSRYAERLARSANSFDTLYEALQNEPSFIDEILIEILSEKVEKLQPDLICLSIPFPGNLYSGLRIGQWVKGNTSSTKVVMGGGFPNTELRSLQDKRVFEFVDFICLDDGEAPLEHVIEHINSKRDIHLLKRTFVLHEDKVLYCNGSLQRDYKQPETGTPDYSDLLLDQYISVLEVANPMHRLWSDGRWNKLTMAHGCYWRNCTFCDISLSYIQDYEPLTAKLICDRMQQIITQTGQSGFHFVDEAAPPSLMKEVAIEIIKRNMAVSWWTNIRFEKSFTRDLCFLLKASGCIGVSGGLEVASDRLLKLINKGVTIDQVALVNKHFTQAGIMVHAYLMYGFPTQTAQETIDSLEIVRQMFKTGILKSAFWHQFAMTAHSPVGLEPEKFGVQKVNDVEGTFANNDIDHVDPKGAQPEVFSFGLKKSLFNYMNQLCLDDPLSTWFETKVPKTAVPNESIQKILEDDIIRNHKPSERVIWLGAQTSISYFTKSKKGQQWEMATIKIFAKSETVEIVLGKLEGAWLMKILNQANIANQIIVSFGELQVDYESQEGLLDFDLFWYNKPMNSLYKYGLLVVS